LEPMEVGNVGVLGLGEGGLGFLEVGFGEFDGAGVALGQVDNRGQGRPGPGAEYSEKQTPEAIGGEQRLEGGIGLSKACERVGSDCIHWHVWSKS
jgi:hypothetical protein